MEDNGLVQLSIDYRIHELGEQLIWELVHRGTLIRRSTGFYGPLWVKAIMVAHRNPTWKIKTIKVLLGSSNECHSAINAAYRLAGVNGALKAIGTEKAKRSSE